MMTGRAWVAAGLLCLAGCKGQAPPAPLPPAAVEASAAEAGFEVPPQVLTIQRLPSGALELHGKAAPNSAVRLASPRGQAFSALADDQGAWTITAPALDQPALYGLSARRGERAVQAEGYVALLPAPGPAAALLRAGAGAAFIGPAGSGVHIEALDADAAGAATVSGSAAGGATLTVYIDGKAAGEGVARDDGRFSIALANPLGAANQIVVKGGGAEAQAQAAMGAPARLSQPPYQAERQTGGWRIDWPTPGGGVQTTLIFDRSSPGAAV